MKKRTLGLVAGLCAGLAFTSCGSSKTKSPPSGLTNRVLASQGVTSATTIGGVWIVNAYNDTLPRVAPINAGTSPGLMAISPSRNTVAVFDSATNRIYAINTASETALGQFIQLPGPTSSMVVPTSSNIAYTAVPAAFVNGYSFEGAVEQMNLASSSIVTTMAVSSAQTVVSNAAGNELLVFSSDSDSMTVLFPSNAVPPVDTSCLTNPPNGVCVVVPGFSRPVYAIVNGNIAYVLNCGLQCGGTQQASVSVFNMTTMTISSTTPVDAATWAFLNGTTLYVAGTSPTNNACTGETTAATTCGRLDILDVSGAVPVLSTQGIVITDGYHDRMDMSVNGQLFIGSYDCTNIGDVSNPSGEVRGCLSIYNTTNSTVVIPPDNGDVDGLQSFTSRYVEYVCEGGFLRVYDTTIDALLLDDYIQEGTINIVGYVGDVKAIDFF